MKKNYKVLLLKISAVLLSAIVLLCLSVLIVNLAMIDSTKDKIYAPSDMSKINQNYDYILILGTGLNPDGTPINRLADRVEVGVEAYKKGLAGKIIMSGDRSGENYDEPTSMKNYAIQLGVPESDIICDYVGYSTHESMYNFKNEHKNASVIVVTQEYHLYRSLYLCKEQGIDDAIGISSTLDKYDKPIWNGLREILARFKDLVFLN
ncbi:MAG: YdcF family protein [Ruminococcaceae bacterium]|nr:YdcF family protein [Oscillospiraceae bacterium]